MPRLSLLPPLAVCILSIACVHASAAPTPYSTMFVFGDSLSDSGQYLDLGGIPDNGIRFTNRTGPTYKDYTQEAYAAVAPMLLGLKLGIASGDLAPSTSMTNASSGLPDGNNWAVGGYRTDQILRSITTNSTVSIPQGMFLASFTLRSLLAPVAIHQR